MADLLAIHGRRKYWVLRPNRKAAMAKAMPPLLRPVVQGRAEKGRRGSKSRLDVVERRKEKVQQSEKSGKEKKRDEERKAKSPLWVASPLFRRLVRPPPHSPPLPPFLVKLLPLLVIPLSSVPTLPPSPRRRMGKRVYTDWTEN